MKKRLKVMAMVMVLVLSFCALAGCDKEKNLNVNTTIGTKEGLEAGEYNESTSQIVMGSDFNIYANVKLLTTSENLSGPYYVEIIVDKNEELWTFEVRDKKNPIESFETEDSYVFWYEQKASSLDGNTLEARFQGVALDNKEGMISCNIRVYKSLKCIDKEGDKYKDEEAIAVLADFAEKNSSYCDIKEDCALEYEAVDTGNSHTIKFVYGE